MHTVLIAGSKGGVGKTTIATQLAAHYALEGRHTVLVDGDPQQSSTRWAERRAALDSAVLPLDGTCKGWHKRVPDDVQRMVIDAPAGAMPDDLQRALDLTDAVVVPVQPSMLDIEAIVGFLNALAKHPRVRKGDLRVGLVANRLKQWTNSSQQALELLAQWPYPVVARLRDSQAYVMLCGLGKSVFDYQSQQMREHQDDWAPLLTWLSK